MIDQTSPPGGAGERSLLDAQRLDRRRFLTQLGAMSALGAGFLSFGNVARGMARIAGTAGGATAARPINIVCLGDSIMWGQGLLEVQRFQALVEQWVGRTNAMRRPTRRWNFAHSGAGVGLSPDIVYRSAWLAFQKAGQSGKADVLAAQLPNPDSLAWVVQQKQLAKGATRIQETGAGDRLGGEIPRTFPTLWRQLELAQETLRTGRDPRGIVAGTSAPVDPGEIDLVLLDGGANDVGFVDTVASPLLSVGDVQRRVDGLVRPRMGEFLPAALAAFPNATFVVTGYYAGISPMSSVAKLTPLFNAVLSMMDGPGAAAVSLLGDDMVKGMIARMGTFDSAMSNALTDLVREHGGGRAVFVSPGFAPENAYGAPRSFIFHVEDTDPAEPARKRECDALLGQWLGQAFGPNAKGARPADTPPWVMCNEANTFHPNPAGASRYAERIIGALQSLAPAWLTEGAGRTARLEVQGSVAGETKTVVVNAFDASSGAPLTGTVTIAGASGQTGTAIQFPSCDAPAPEGSGAKGTVRRPPPRAAATPCAGTVQIPGYPATSFRY